MKICIDPGHQSRPDLRGEPMALGSSILKARTAPGTTGVRTGIPEYEIALQIALTAEAQLLEQRFEVVLTRRVNDIQLSNIERADIANSSNASFCLKIHCNGVRPSLKYITFWKRGMMTLIPAPKHPTTPIYKSSLMIAEILHGNLIKATSFPDLGIRTRDDLTGFNWSHIPVVLLEIGYLTNPIEEAQLVDKSFQVKVASAITKGAADVYERVNFQG
jgi:N-acetylmuramoyl-L-alanine amidase